MGQYFSWKFAGRVGFFLTGAFKLATCTGYMNLPRSSSLFKRGFLCECVANVLRKMSVIHVEYIFWCLIYFFIDGGVD